jgi:DNA-binding IclR family transcriptional regulator
MEVKYGDDSWPQKKEGLDRAMEDYKKYGFCLSIGEWDRNINSAGVPVHLQDGTIMALTCAAPSYLVPAERLRESIAHQLAMLASDIESLGV